MVKKLLCLRKHTLLNAGVSKTCLKNGIRRKNDSAVGKNARKSSQKPYDSSTNPTNVHPHTTNMRPPKKNPVPL